MDEIVLRGMAKWPNVPAVYGWLALDRRGQWRIKGELISNPAVSAFIGRNFERDERGCWFFQNGPQRVFVSLAYTPLVLRLAGEGRATLDLETHTGRRVERVEGAWLDEDGSLLLLTEHGPGLVHDGDLERITPRLVDANGNPLEESVLEDLVALAASDAAFPVWLRFREASVKVNPVSSREVPATFSFVSEPQPSTA